MRNEQENRRRAAVVVAAISMIMAAATAAPAQTFKVVHSFAGGTDGASPVGGLILGASGELYGTTELGGHPKCHISGCGTIFELSSGETETVLFSFNNPGKTSGFPETALVEDAAGNLYGTTQRGGAGGFECGAGCGTVYKRDVSGMEGVLYSFRGVPDGETPVAGLTIDPLGNLYGTTEYGGDERCQCGIVFKVDPSGNETVLHAFTGGTDGANSFGALTLDLAGNLYGTTQYGGDETNCYRGCGTVFKVDTNGTETVLYSFAGGSDGSNPYAGVIRDAAGNLYGTTIFGGVAGCGNVFELTSGGAENVLYSFSCGTDGGKPTASLIRDAAGNLYGTASEYGDLSCAHGTHCGTVFEVSSGGAFTVLHRFTGRSDGGWAQSGVIMNLKGTLYGVATLGGAFSEGVLYAIQP